MVIGVMTAPKKRVQEEKGHSMVATWNSQEAQDL